MNFRRLRLGVGFAAVLAMAMAAAGLAQVGVPPPPPPPAAGVAPPPPPPPAAGVTPAATAAPTSLPQRGKRARPAASGSPTAAPPTETPAPPQFTTLDGIWEVELQPAGQRLANYSHLDIIVNGSALSGYWERGTKTKRKTPQRSPMIGTFDGRLISLSVVLPDGSNATFSGYVEAFSDMVGVYRANEKDSGTAFTAEHRKKLKT